MNLIGKKAFGISGPGQWPEEGLAGREGIITNIETCSTTQQKVYWIEWEDDNTEPYYQIEPASEKNGCGVYYKEEGKK